MITFFNTPRNTIVAVETTVSISEQSIDKLNWLFGNFEVLKETELAGTFVGPRRELISPWSSTAVEIVQNMVLYKISIIE